MTEINWSNVKKEAPEWFRDAKFGLFFHWGPYSVPAYMNEWYSRNMYAKGIKQNKYHEETYGNVHDFGYKDFYPMMKGEKFDPKEWTELVRLSGAKYAGPVSEHADNFSMWDSQVNPVNCVNYGPKRDVAGECLSAFKEAGIHTLATFHHQWLWGWFMSTDNEADVYDPANEKFYGPALPLETNRYIPYRYPDEAFCRTWRDKVLEFIDKYEPEELYFDSRSCIIEESFRYEVADYYYNVKGIKNGIITYKQEDFPAEVGVLDLERGRTSKPKQRPWQCDDRLEDNVTWCMVQEPKYKSAERIIHLLCDIVSKNGNLLLNVGPYADGSFHPEAVRILKEIGEWLALNGEAIYGTRPYSIAAEGGNIEDRDYDIEKINEQLDNGGEAALDKDVAGAQEYRFTTKGEQLYVIAMRWPEDGCFHVTTLREGGCYEREIENVTMVGCEEALEFVRDEKGLHITAPDHKPCACAYVLRV